MDGQNRGDIKPGLLVDIVLKADQPTGNLTRGIVAELLTSSSFHPRGIKVRLKDGQVGRVQKIIREDQTNQNNNIVDKIYDTAEAFRSSIERGAGIKLNYDAESIMMLDGIIDRILSSQIRPDPDQTISLFACFLGEAMIRTFNGHWEQNKNGNMAVVLRSTNGGEASANVFSKVEKRFTNGIEDSLTYYYQMLQNVLSEKKGA